MGDEWEKLLLKYPDAKNDLDKFKDNLKLRVSGQHPPICKRQINTSPSYHCPSTEGNTSLLLIILSILIVIVVLLSINLGLKIKKGT